MGLFDVLRNELIDIVEWLDDTNGRTLVWRFPRFRNEIKNGAQLIVRPGQRAILVDQGKVADVFDEGRHVLSTDNLPLLSTLKGWKHGFESPFKAEVYFVSTRQVTDLKWGTPNPIMLRDPEFGPIRLRAFGIYTLKAQDPTILLRELVGTDGDFEASEVTELLRSIIATSFAEALGESKIAALDLASSYQRLSETLAAKVNERIDDEYGLQVPFIQIVNISLPEAVEAALDTRSSMGVIGDMAKFQQYQMGQAMTQAASNQAPGGGASTGVGLGVGLAMAQQMMQAQPAASMGPPPLPPQSGTWHVSIQGAQRGPLSIAELGQLVSAGEISAKNYVWRPGMGGWQAASEIPELNALFVAVPPPPPDAP